MMTTMMTTMMSNGDARDVVLDGFRADELRRVEERVCWAEEMMNRIVNAGWVPPQQPAKPKAEGE